MYPEDLSVKLLIQKKTGKVS